MRSHIYRPIAAILLIAAGGHQLAAKDKHKQGPDPAKDQITVEAHIAVPGAPITQFTATRHYNRAYVYAERGPGQPVTLLDVTNPAKPTILSQVAASPGTASNFTGSLVAVAGTAALSTTAGAAATPPAQTIRMMDFSDPSNPGVTQQFDGVTAVQKLSNGLIMLANGDGIWILAQHLADDPEADARYARKVVYGESMY